MSEIIDARGLSCPQPVILAKKGVEKHGDVIVIVDNTAALENVKRMGGNSGCEVSVENPGDGTFKIHLRGTPGEKADKEKESISCDWGSSSSSVPAVIVLAGDKMGKGNDELGTVLMKAFIHTLVDAGNTPETIILYNTGVNLAVKGSDTVDDLNKLEEAGAKILVCGTCANFFNIKDKLSAGTISNMYDIANAMIKAGRLIMP
ncbi:MAG: sulfurtransferase-like selenium metabolism protein YedF [Spirochaetes bacterium]|jgi:selenium metabolism protein YedF|nr:sulfurtransferase-like selenium metabolism protein YedF [Spirochaetota bacterium]